MECACLDVAGCFLGEPPHQRGCRWKARPPPSGWGYTCVFTSAGDGIQGMGDGVVLVAGRALGAKLTKALLPEGVAQGRGRPMTYLSQE